MNTAAPTLPAPKSRARRYVSRGIKSMLIGAVIALVFTLVFSQDFWHSLVYGVSISTCCWFSIDTGRIIAARLRNRNCTPEERLQRGQWPGWGWMIAIIVGGTILGYTTGNAIGNWITGRHAPGIILNHPRQALAVLVFSLVPGLGATYFFYSRERLAASEAAAQTAQREAAENQLRLLESQLEPHMLFNTLANLRVLIGTDPPRAQQMLDQLIAFLRATLNASRVGSHALGAEFGRLKDYLALMSVRMGERLQTDFELPADLADMPVPPLILQPLVENSIKHGIEPKVDGGRIEVRAARVGAQVVLSVRDSGAGLAFTEGPAGSGFGVVQVRQRLATLYGDRASLTVAAAPEADGGTIATITLPAP